MPESFRERQENKQTKPTGNIVDTKSKYLIRFEKLLKGLALASSSIKTPQGYPCSIWRKTMFSVKLFTLAERLQMATTHIIIFSYSDFTRGVKLAEVWLS